MGLRILILTCAGFVLLCAVGFLLLPSRAPTGLPAQGRPPPEPPPLPASASPSPAPPAPQAPTAGSPPPTSAPPEPRPAVLDPAPDADGVLRVPPARWVAETRAELGRLLELCLASEGLDVPRPIRIDVQLGYHPEDGQGPRNREVSVSDPGPWLRACASDALLDAAIPDPGGPAEFEHTVEFTWEADG